MIGPRAHAYSIIHVPVLFTDCILAVFEYIINCWYACITVSFYTYMYVITKCLDLFEQGSICRWELFILTVHLL